MIQVTRINKTDVFFVNEDLIEFIEETPDTIISLSTDKKILVMESADTVIERIKEAKRGVWQGREELLKG
ncbi:MAG: flagellar FlbD family protein [Oscillospiraceae bacterium]|jgi:flagellar protein FlbD|nr:flagellar FlbD family protein [Oscillospiraceae bacterium]